MYSAWIGEHHFGTLGVLSCPDLASLYRRADTRIRLSPAVTVLPLHHPIRVAEQWATLDLLSGGRVDFAAGRGYDRQDIFLSGCRSKTTRHFRGRNGHRSTALVGGKADSHRGRHLHVRRCPDHAETGAASDPVVRRVVLEAFDRVCRAFGLRGDCGAICCGDDLWRACAGRGALS